MLGNYKKNKARIIQEQTNAKIFLLSQLRNNKTEKWLSNDVQNMVIDFLPAKAIGFSHSYRVQLSNIKVPLKEGSFVAETSLIEDLGNDKSLSGNLRMKGQSIN